MYAWIWHKLPGNVATKLLCALVLAAAVLWVLFGYVYPWVDDLLGFGGTLWT
jgi:hypothetical protein